MGLSIAQVVIFGVGALLSMAITTIALLDYLKTDENTLQQSLSIIQRILVLSAISLQYLQVGLIVYSIVTIKQDLSNILNGVVSWLVIAFTLTSYLVTYPEYQAQTSDSSFIGFTTDQIIQICLGIALAFRYGIPFFGTDKKASRICDFGGNQKTEEVNDEQIIESLVIILT